MLQLEKAHAATKTEQTINTQLVTKQTEPKLPEAAERGPGLGLLCAQEARS